MTKLTWIFCLLVFCSSCGQDDESAVSVVRMEKPADLIPEDKMIHVMADVHLLESAIGFRSPRPISRMPNAPGSGTMSPQIDIAPPAQAEQKIMPYYDVFKKHGYTREQYENSLRWYSQNPKHFSEMYDEVISELTRRQAGDQQAPGVTPVATDPAK
ncbi:MAG TPA: DUF4296 domain-containing protein [Bacteroidia bacterium]|nr:DUF4296 domain-containing protein [Bacteroidia bacterium]